VLVEIAAIRQQHTESYYSCTAGLIETRAWFALLVLNPSSRSGSFCVGIVPTIIFY
jgi:hypothetical protein